MSRLFITLVLSLAISVNLISARSNARMRHEDGIYCHQEGLNAIPDKSNEFLICAKDGEGNFMGAIYSCSDSEVFDKNTMSCVKPMNRRMLRSNIMPFCECGGSEDPVDDGPDPPLETSTECNNRTIQCSDCHTLRLCYESGGVFQHLRDVSCNEGDYCDDRTASCTSVAPPSCPADFFCTGSGYFPDLSDCTKYYICYLSGKDYVAATQYCAANQVYSVSKSMCVAKLKPTDCQKLKCPAGPLKFVPYPGDASYYAVCIDGKPEYIYHCGESKEFDQSTNSCEVICKSAGRMPDPDNCNQYYECTAGLFGKFTLTSNSCPPGLGFNKATLLCDGTSCK